MKKLLGLLLFLGFSWLHFFHLFRFRFFLLVFLILLRLGLGAGFRRLLLRLLLLRLFQDGPDMAASEPKGGMGKKEIKDI